MTTQPAEREITAPVDLCGPDGRLAPDAVGWSRTPLHRTALPGWGRTKRWEYWGVVSPTHVVGVTVSSLDYAAVHGVYVLDRRTHQETTVDVVVPLGRGVVLADRACAGRTTATARGLDVDIVDDDTGTRLRLESRDVGLDLTVPRDPDRDLLAVVVPWSPRRFQYTVKDVGRPAAGVLRVGRGTAAETHHLPAGETFAVLDHGRGRWPYRCTWNWAAGARDGLALQLGGRWTDGTGSTENALVLDGRVHKISEDLTWTYDRADWSRPWRVTGDRVDVTLDPEHVRVARTELAVVGSSTHQAFGTFRGRVQADDGTWVTVDGLQGWAEEARQRW